MPQPSRKLILHIGHHKTGSTTIQGALAANLLEVDGRPPLYLGAFNHNYLVRHFNLFNKEARVLPGDSQLPNLDQIDEMLAQREYRHAILSGERFSGADPAVVAAVLKKFMLSHVQEHSVLCYVRPHAARTLSEFAERIKVGSFAGSSISRFHNSGPKDGRFQFAPRLKAWASVFDTRFLVRPFHRDFLENGDILDDFATYAFPGSDTKIYDRTTSNESSTLETLVLLRVIQSHLKSHSEGLRLQLGWTLTLELAARSKMPEPGEASRDPKTAVMKVVRELATIMSEAQGRQKTKVALDKRTAGSIRSTYLHDANILDQTVFSANPLMRRELDHAMDLAIDKPQSMEALDYHHPDTIRRINELSAELNSLIGKDDSRWTDYFRRRRINIGLRENTAPAARSSVEAVTSTPPVKPERLDIAVLDRMILAAEGNRDRLNLLSKKLHNAYSSFSAKNTHIDPQALVARIGQGGAESDVLREYLVTRFFQRNIRELSKENGRVLRLDGQAARDLAVTLPALTETHIAMLNGGIAYIRKDLEAAYTLFDAARRSLMASGTVRHHNGGLLSMRPFSAFKHWSRGDFGVLKPAPLAKPIFISDARFSTDFPVVVVGMDRIYYDRYAQRLIDSARGRANLHFHIVNPGDGALYSEPHVRYSVETATCPTAGYYASLRFLHLQVFLSHYERPIMTADADSYFFDSPQPVVNFSRGADVAITTGTDVVPKRAFLAAVPWRVNMANIFVANPTHGAERFLSSFVNIYQGLASDDPTGPHWWVDQALLSIVSDIVEPEGVFIKRGWLFKKSGMEQRKMR